MLRKLHSTPSPNERKIFPAIGTEEHVDKPIVARIVEDAYMMFLILLQD